MMTNADCTIFEKDTCTSHIVRDVYWFDARGTVVSKSGIQIADSVLVYLYNADYAPKAGDILVKGASDFTFAADSPQAVSESMRRFRTVHPDYAVVKSVQDARYGGLPHIEVIAR